jgi:Dos2-interacting transcription regulator of RNA-Pol-II
MIQVDLAFGCLSGVINAFARDTLSLHEIDVLATFYCERLADEAVTKENISGLTTLIDMSACGEEQARKICLA